MPSLNFVLPHWLYWGTLIAFPLIAMYLVRRQQRRGVPRRASVFIAYLFWVTSGFMGLHRLYLRSYWGLVFVPLFLGALHVNDQVRDAREDVSRTRAALESVHVQLNRLRPLPGVEVTPELREQTAKAEADVRAAQSEFAAAEAELDRDHSISRWLAYLIAALMLVDAALIPWLVRRVNAREIPEVEPGVALTPDVAMAGTHEDPTLGLHTRITDIIEVVNESVGEFVAYWAVISVFAYFYEVMARYVFNSPTNWVHESMFLMYGMQYMLAGAYAYKEDQHVRVDVIYVKFSERGKAIADVITSVFFFIFVLTMLWTTTRFALDSINPGGSGEVSFTEWGIQYWPVKLTMPIGAALLGLQGVSKLIKDIVFLTHSWRA